MIKDVFTVELFLLVFAHFQETILITLLGLRAFGLRAHDCVELRATDGFPWTFIQLIVEEVLYH